MRQKLVRCSATVQPEVERLTGEELGYSVLHSDEYVSIWQCAFVKNSGVVNQSVALEAVMKQVMRAIAVEAVATGAAASLQTSTGDAALRWPNNPYELDILFKSELERLALPQSSSMARLISSPNLSPALRYGIAKSAWDEFPELRAPSSMPPLSDMNTRDRDMEIAAYWRADWRLDMIANRFHISEKTVQNILTALRKMHGDDIAPPRRPRQPKP